MYNGGRHLDDFPYIGKFSYALEFTTLNRSPRFRDTAAIDLVVAQFRRAAGERGFHVIHCAMPDHVHLVVDGERDDSNCLAFIRLAKQYSGYHYKKSFGQPLWQRYGFERIIRDDAERALTIRYLLMNPVRAGLVRDPREYYGLGSDQHTIAQLMQIAEYSEHHLLR